MLYIVKSGEDLFEYERLCEDMNLRIINQFLHIKNFPLLNGDDMQILRNSGGTAIFRKTRCFYWLINLEHEQDEKITPIGLPHVGNELVRMITNYRNSVKRD